MKVSAGEYSSTCLKACLGAGIERGLAVEIGPACAEMALRGINPLSELIALFADIEGSENRWEKSANGWSIREIRSLENAISMVDFATVSGLMGTHATDIQIPDFLIGLCLHRTRSQRVVFEMSIQGGKWLSLAADSVKLFELAKTGKISLRCDPNASIPELQDITAIDVSTDDWESLSPWTYKTLVPADHASRADAGAGNTDND